MAENDICPIWDTLARLYKGYTSDGVNVDSPRAGGAFFVARKMIGKLDDREKARLTTWLIEQRRLGVECPEIR